MKRAIITSLAVALVWTGVGLNFASAQFGTLGQPPARRPAVSPYINLGIGGGGAVSYYGLIKPQIDANRSIVELQNVVTHMNPDGSLRGQLDAQGQGQTGQTGLQTGHAAQFFNYGHYYPIAGPGGATSTGTGMGYGPGMGGFNSNFGPGGNINFGTGPQRGFFGGAFGTNLR